MVVTCKWEYSKATASTVVTWSIIFTIAMIANVKLQSGHGRAERHGARERDFDVAQRSQPLQFAAFILSVPHYLAAPPVSQSICQKSNIVT